MFKLFERMKKKKAEKSSPAAGRWILREIFTGQRRNEVKGIAWWAASLLLAAAFWPADAGRNALGPSGEIVFRLSFALLGLILYAAPFIIAAYGWVVFHGLEISGRTQKKFGLVLTALAGCILVELIHPQSMHFNQVKYFYTWSGAASFWSNLPGGVRIWDGVALPAGGFAARWSGRLLISVFSVTGAYIICATMLIISFYLLEVETWILDGLKGLAGRFHFAVKNTQAIKSRFDYAPVASVSKSEVDRPKIKITLPAAARVQPEAVLPKPDSPKPKNNSEEDKPGFAPADQKKYELPDAEFLDDPKGPAMPRSEYFEGMSQTLEKTLGQFGVAAKVVEVCPGPVVTRYELQPAPGVKVNRIIALADDIALAMKAEHVRIEAPIPGKGAVGIELPNQEKQIVGLKEFVVAREFQAASSVLTFAVGKDIGGKQIFAPLDGMPHLLIAGSTGSGKSACINDIICSLLYRATPHDVRFLMIDPKRVELTMYNGIPHLKSPVITDSREAAVALKFMVREMEQRYKLFAQAGVRDIVSYNRNRPAAEEADAGESVPRMPYIVIFIDELADLMMISANEVENTITRLAQMARGVGIHMVLATQRPSVDVITGVIKANFPSRIAFQVSSKVDSRTILDANGADALLGRGDMLYAPASAGKPLRVQGVFITTVEVERIVKFWKDQGAPVFDAAFSPEKLKSEEPTTGEENGADELYHEAVQWVARAKQASTSMLQRRLKVGYSRAARLLDMMEERGVVGPPDGSKPRKVLLPPETDGVLAGEKGAGDE